MMNKLIPILLAATLVSSDAAPYTEVITGSFKETTEFTDTRVVYKIETADDDNMTLRHVLEFDKNGYTFKDTDLSGKSGLVEDDFKYYDSIPDDYPDLQYLASCYDGFSLETLLSKVGVDIDVTQTVNLNMESIDSAVYDIPADIPTSLFELPLENGELQTYVRIEDASPSEFENWGRFARIYLVAVIRDNNGVEHKHEIFYWIRREVKVG